MAAEVGPSTVTHVWMDVMRADYTARRRRPDARCLTGPGPVDTIPASEETPAPDRHRDTTRPGAILRRGETDHPTRGAHA